jgi:hypothetical protein
VIYMQPMDRYAILPASSEEVADFG